MVTAGISARGAIEVHICYEIADQDADLQHVNRPELGATHLFSLVAVTDVCFGSF